MVLLRCPLPLQYRSPDLGVGLEDHQLSLSLRVFMVLAGLVLPRGHVVWPLVYHKDR